MQIVLFRKSCEFQLPAAQTESFWLLGKAKSNILLLFKQAFVEQVKRNQKHMNVSYSLPLFMTPVEVTESYVPLTF